MFHVAKMLEAITKYTALCYDERYKFLKAMIIIVISRIFSAGYLGQLLFTDLNLFFEKPGCFERLLVPIQYVDGL